MQNRQKCHFIANGTDTHRLFESYANINMLTTATFEFTPTATASFAVLFTSIGTKGHIFDTQSAGFIHILKTMPQNPTPVTFAREYDTFLFSIATRLTLRTIEPLLSLDITGD